MQNAWEQIVMAVLAAYGALITWAWKHTHGLIRVKADAVALQGIVSRFDQKMKEDKDDRERIYDKIDRMASAFHTHSEMVIRELGERPRRGQELTCAILHCPLREELQALKKNGGN
ncbi:MAG: hypothetical protein Q8P46_18680 [Hyphomicrobiales bacterium]|nr:hypothetical protein [Hyphomicrobiales bacterium]